MTRVNPGVPVTFDKIQKSFGAVRVLEELNLAVEPGEFLVVLLCADRDAQRHSQHQRERDVQCEANHLKNACSVAPAFTVWF